MHLNTRHSYQISKLHKKAQTRLWIKTKPFFRPCPIYRNLHINIEICWGRSSWWRRVKGSQGPPYKWLLRDPLLCLLKHYSISISWTSQGSGTGEGVCILHFWCPSMAPLLSNYGPSNCRWHGMNHFSPFSLLRHKMQMSASDLKLYGFFC